MSDLSKLSVDHSLFIALVDFEQHTVLARDNTENLHVCGDAEAKKHSEHCFIKCETMKQCSIFGRTRATLYFCNNVGISIRNFQIDLIAEEPILMRGVMINTSNLVGNDHILEKNITAVLDNSSVFSSKQCHSRKNLIVHLFLFVHIP